MLADQLAEQPLVVAERGHYRARVLGRVVPAAQPQRGLAPRAGLELRALAPGSSGRPGCAACARRPRTAPPKYPGSTAHRYRLAATCSRTGSVTPGPNHCASQSAPWSPCRLSVPLMRCWPLTAPVKWPTSCSRAARDQLRCRASPLGQGRGLEQVLGLGHRLAQIFAGALGGEEVRDDPYRVGCCHVRSFRSVHDRAAEILSRVACENAAANRKRRVFADPPDQR